MIKLRAFAIALSSLVFFGCNNKQPEANTHLLDTDSSISATIFPVAKSIDSLSGTTMQPTMDEPIAAGENVIYASAFMYAWDEVGKLLKGDLTCKESDTSQLSYLTKFKGYKNTLQPNEYSASAYFDNDAIVAEAQFKKLLPFKHELQQCGPLNFNGRYVKSFGIIYYKDYLEGVVDILHYKNDAEFVIRINDKEGKHSVYLFMSPNYSNTQARIHTAMQKAIHTGKAEKSVKRNAWKFVFNENDNLQIPEFSFNIIANYNKLTGPAFYCNGESHHLVIAKQRTAFVMNYKGAAVESEAYAAADSAYTPTAPPQPKHMIFNKPFAVFVQRNDADNPYFAMMVNNTELMVPIPTIKQ